MSQLDDLMRAVGRVEGKLDSVAEHFAVVDHRLDAYSQRISCLEKWRTYLVGAGTVVMAGIVTTFRALWEK